MKIVKLKDVAQEAYKEILSFQQEDKSIKTGKSIIDDRGISLQLGNVVVVGALTGVGKSYFLAEILKNILNKEINPHADDYVSLNISLEMRLFSLLLREINGKIGKTKRKILHEEFTEEELKIVEDYMEDLNDDRRYISQTPTTVNQFYTETKKFLEKNKNKKVAIVSLDHLVLVQSDSNDNKNQVVEKLIESINMLKMEYHNAVFILLSQLNSNILSRLNEKDRKSQVALTDFYYSMFITQIADYVIGLVNPGKMGIQEYSKIKPERYPHLHEFFTEEDNKGRCSLRTDGVIYEHLVKCREGDPYETDIEAVSLEIPEEWKEKKETKQQFTSDFFEEKNDEPF